MDSGDPYPERTFYRNGSGVPLEVLVWNNKHKMCSCLDHPSLRLDSFPMLYLGVNQEGKRKPCKNK